MCCIAVYSNILNLGMKLILYQTLYPFLHLGLPELSARKLQSVLFLHVFLSDLAATQLESIRQHCQPTFLKKESEAY
jgi:hypothetical protein